MNLSTTRSRGSSFEDHMSLYASHNIQEAALRAQTFQHVEADTTGQKPDIASLLRRTAVGVTVTSLLGLLMDRLLTYVY